MVQSVLTEATVEPGCSDITLTYADYETIHRRGASGFEPPVTVAQDGTVTTPLLPGFELPLDRVLS